nr:methyltransferase [Pedobacter panaciterrae]
MGSIFKFKQFEVNQSGCAMKINTDGVLLGAIVQKNDAQQILDIGTGTGVIALMLAQRFPDAHVDAVEIDESAALAASANFSNSGFYARLKAYHVAIASYNTDVKYDLIVSNPPYFVNDLKNPEQRKGIARHADQDFFELLLLKTSELLADDGCIWLILPVKQAEFVVSMAVTFNLSLSERINICSDESKPVFRHVICLQRKLVTPKISNFFIYESEKIYTEGYKRLLKDFLLAF